MNDFKNYLITKYKYSARTLQEKERHIENWQKLCLQGQELEKLTTKALLNLIETQQKKYKIPTLNNQIKTLEQYYNYLVETKKRKDHPLRHFRIKPETKPILQGLLTEQELTEIYTTYPSQGHLGGQFNYYKQRNKVILGLMIYQGLDSSTLEQLEIHHIDVEKAIVQVPRISEYKLQERILTLKSNQILELHKYLTQTRKELLRFVKTEQETNKLFPKSKKTRFSSITKALKKPLQIENIYQLRYSRIVLWLKQYNLIEVQYRAGYKSLLSLEKFHSKDLEKLRQSIEKYHPF